MGLPRGGVPVAAEVASALGAPLDVILVRKLGVPGQDELAMGAVGEDATRVVNADVVDELGLQPSQVADVEHQERAELERRRRRYRGSRARVDLRGRTVIVVDDGLATGATARAAIQVARAQGAGEVVLAVPVAPPSTVAELEGEADEVVVLETPEPFYAVGLWYVAFPQTSDEEVADTLQRAG